MVFSITSIVFFWEVLRPMPLPILLNRRTRELYFEQEGEIYHTPWDGIAAATYAYGTVGPYTAGMRHAALEALLHRYGHPQEQVVINLGSPTGKSLEMQLGFWEYLRAYMDNGPWFDELGRHSDSPEHLQAFQEVRNSKGQSVRLYWGLIKEEYKANKGRNFLSYADFMLLFGSMMLLPVRILQNFTYAMAKRRSRSQWPQMIRERLRAAGPTSRLVDLEQFLEQCCWGNARRWDDSPEQASAELQTLIDLLFKPRLQATGLLTSRHSGGSDQSIVIGSKTDSLQLYLPGADPSHTQLHLRLAAISAAGTPTDCTRQWLATVQSQWLPIHQGMGLCLSGKLPSQPEGGHWQLQVIYHSPLAMLTGTLNPRQLVVGGTQGMRYIIRGTSITEHDSNDGPLLSDSLPAVEVERTVLTPEDQ